MKPTDFLANVLKGAVIGISNMIPGVSGGTMMVAMGIYDKLIHILTHIKSAWKQNAKFIVSILIGVLLAIVLLSKLFEYLLAVYPVATNLAFCGLIAGSLPVIFAKVKSKPFDKSDAICFGIFFLLVLGGSLIKSSSDHSVVLSLTLLGVLRLVGVGFITAATMVIPGVSGSMILMLLGYYEPILRVISTAVDAITSVNFGSLMWCILILIPYLAGVILGIFAIASLVEWIFSRWKIHAHWAIIGLICASPLAILIQTNWVRFSFGQLVVGLICFAACWFGVSRLSRLS